jgi:hypothetical protein
MRGLLSGLLVLISSAHGASPDSIAQLSASQQLEVRQALSRAQVAFVGRVDRVDAEWTGYTGAAGLVTKGVHFVGVQPLKGSLPSSIDVHNIMLGQCRWVEQRSTGGLRLSPRFFKTGHSYVVLAAKELAPRDDRLFFTGDSCTGAWIASPENVSTVKAMLGK